MIQDLNSITQSNHVQSITQSTPAEEVFHKPIRRHDLDWLRVILFALLIWFHYSAFSQLQSSVQSV